ncbi:hypothetical protein Hanom_Chr02g00095971 [Helianthus anomalus]
MSNISLKNLVKYHPHHPQPEVVIENFGLLKDANYVDPDPVYHQDWRNEEERKEAMYAVELKIIQGFKPTKNEWYVKESGRRRRLATPVAECEGSLSQPKMKQKKKAQTILVTTCEDFVLDTDVFETGPEVVADVDKEKEKIVDDIEGDDVDKDTTSSSSMSEYEMVDTRESEKRMREELEKEKMLRKRKRAEKEDELYVPSPEHVSASKSSSRITKKAGGRKKSTSNVRMTKRPQKILNTPPSQPTPPKQPSPPQSPIHQSPPRQPTPPQSPKQPTPPPHSTPPRLPTPQHTTPPIHQSTPPQQPMYSSQDLFGTPPCWCMFVTTA